MKENPWLWIISPFLHIKLLYVCFRRLLWKSPDVYYKSDMQDAVENVFELIVCVGIGCYIGFIVHFGSFFELFGTLATAYVVGIFLEIPRVSSFRYFQEIILMITRLLNYINLGFLFGIAANIVIIRLF